jgi:hypothetical protein
VKTWATGVDSSGCTRQITVGDVWESMADNRIRARIVGFNGQHFDVETIDYNIGVVMGRAIVANFNEFVNNWQIYSYGTPPAQVTPYRETLYDDTKLVKWSDLQKPNCECGAHKLGVKDYAKGHSTWCKVFKDDA